MPIDAFLLALTTFFATIGPADLLWVYAALTPRTTPAEWQQS
jgi:multiple antibiotic resistance protein